MQNERKNPSHFLSENGKQFLQKKIRENSSISSSRICHDTATGVHYGVITCEGCKASLSLISIRSTFSLHQCHFFQGFFKRSITQGIPYRCFFGDKCVINMETRNRCKACRFQRCLEQGMAMESVKMGRIPKKVKEKALRNYQKYQERKSQQQQQQIELLDNEEFIDSETDNSSLSGFIRESTSSSSSEHSNMNISQSFDSNQETIVIPPSKSPFIHRIFPIRM